MKGRREGRRESSSCVPGCLSWVSRCRRRSRTWTPWPPPVYRGGVRPTPAVDCSRGPGVGTKLPARGGPCSSSRKGAIRWPSSRTGAIRWRRRLASFAGAALARPAGGRIDHRRCAHLPGTDGSEAIELCRSDHQVAIFACQQIDVEDFNYLCSLSPQPASAVGVLAAGSGKAVAAGSAGGGHKFLFRYSDTRRVRRFRVNRNLLF